MRYPMTRSIRAVSSCAVGLLLSAAPPGAGGAAAAPQAPFQRWQHPSGLLSADLPAGWRVSGEIGQAMDLGQFKIEATSPDGRSFVTLAHNWLSFMEFQVGPYRPGNGTVETFVLPAFVQSNPTFSGGLVVYRGANQHVVMTDPYSGMGIPFDGGTLAFLLQRTDGGIEAGTAYGETLYIASPGTPGLWRLRVFAATYSPGDAAAQGMSRGALDRLVASLELSPQFFSLWNQAHDRTVQQMRSYSQQMDRVFSGYLESMRHDSDRDPLQGWSEMMRGGAYAADDETGEQYWVGNDHDHWFVNDRGVVVGNDTGDVPTHDDNWRVLRR